MVPPGGAARAIADARETREPPRCDDWPIFPDLPGCATDAATPEELARTIPEAVASWLEREFGQGHPLPAPTIGGESGWGPADCWGQEPPPGGTAAGPHRSGRGRSPSASTSRRGACRRWPAPAASAAASGARSSSPRPTSRHCGRVAVAVPRIGLRQAGDGKAPRWETCRGARYPAAAPTPYPTRARFAAKVARVLIFERGGGTRGPTPAEAPAGAAWRGRAPAPSIIMPSPGAAVPPVDTGANRVMSLPASSGSGAVRRAGERHGDGAGGGRDGVACARAAGGGRGVAAGGPTRGDAPWTERGGVTSEPIEQGDERADEDLFPTGERGCGARAGAAETGPGGRLQRAGGGLRRRRLAAGGALRYRPRPAAPGPARLGGRPRGEGVAAGGDVAGRGVNVRAAGHRRTVDAVSRGVSRSETRA